MNTPVFIDPEKITLRNWAYTVFFGSMAWPVGFFAFGKMDSGAILLAAVISWILAALTGIPALLLLALLGNLLNKLKLPLEKYALRHFLFHAGISMATFAVMALLLDSPGFVLGLGACYTLTAMLIWCRTFDRIRRKQRSIQENLIDDLTEEETASTH